MNKHCCFYEYQSCRVFVRTGLSAETVSWIIVFTKHQVKDVYEGVVLIIHRVFQNGLPVDPRQPARECNFMVTWAFMNSMLIISVIKNFLERGLYLLWSIKE